MNILSSKESVVLQPPSITQATLDTLNNNASVRLLNNKYMLSEEEAISILEFAARVCYKSDGQRKSTPEQLLKHLINHGHYSIFEHVNYNFFIDYYSTNTFLTYLRAMERSDKFLIKTITSLRSKEVYPVTCNLRSLLELYQFYKMRGSKDLLLHSITHSLYLTWPKIYDIIINDQNVIETKPYFNDIKINDLNRVVDDAQKEHTRYVFHVICTRAIANQIVRHRTLSFSQESTRYINYTKNNADISVYVADPLVNNEKYMELITDAGIYASTKYQEAINNKIKTEDARDVLPLGLKTELVVSGLYRPERPIELQDGFAHFFRLRTHAQPSITAISNEMKKLITNQ